MTRGARWQRIAPALSALVLMPCVALAAPPQAMLEEAREVAARVPEKLMSVLYEELQDKGPAGAIEVCRVKAPAMAREASERTGWEIRRASLGNRTERAAPDSWERSVLVAFDAQQAAGADTAAMERAEVVSEGGRKWVRYAKALPTRQICLQCHGTADELGEGVQARLRALYPNDRAVGYQSGQIRGGLFLKKPLQP